jgi:DNA-binding CsgD family transcriptional regulator
MVYQAYGPALMDLRLDHRLSVGHRALSASRTVGHPGHTVMALCALATNAALRGDRVTAERRIDEAVALADDHDLLTFASIAQRWLAFVHYRFDLDDTAAQAERAVELARRTSNEWDATAGLWLLGLSRLRHGDDDQAAEALYESWEASADPYYPFTRLRSALGLAIIDLRRDRYQDALDRVHEAIAIASQTGDRWGLAAALDHLALLEGLRGAHEHAGRLIGAVDALLSSAGVIRLPFEAALRIEAVDRLARDLGERPAEGIVSTGRTLPVDDALRLARRSRGERKRPSAGWDSLTPAEHAVIRLAVTGLTTSQIADALTVSTNTVKTHLSHVYTKLDIASRAQLATLHSERGGAPPPKGITDGD